MAIKRNNETTHTGLVVSLYTSTFDCGYDTAYHATVWNWKTMQTDSICYGTTRDDKPYNAEVDATPEVQRAYSIYLKSFQLKREIEKGLKETATANRVGYTIRIARGKLVPIGTIGVITHIMETQYGTMIFIKDESNKQHRTYPKNCEVLAIPLSERLLEISRLHEDLKNLKKGPMSLGALAHVARTYQA